MKPPGGYAIVLPYEVKIAQPVIVQYVAPHNPLWYAPYRTIGGGQEISPGLISFAPSGAKRDPKFTVLFTDDLMGAGTAEPFRVSPP